MRVRWRLVVFTLFSVELNLTGMAQDTGDNEIVTDRPDITESAIVVPTASLQAENGATWTGGRHAKGLDICQSLLRLGVGEGYELRLALPSRFEGFSLGLKRQLGPVRGFDVSLIVAASLPVGSTQYRHRVDPFLKIPWSRELGHGWSVGGMQSVFWLTEDGRRNLTWEPTFVVERELTRSAYAFAEYGGDYPQRGDSKQTAHFGAAYKIGSNNQLDLHFGFGLSPATPDRFFAVGYSFRIDRLWGRRSP
jgi:hypothetical protein